MASRQTKQRREWSDHRHAGRRPRHSDRSRRARRTFVFSQILSVNDKGIAVGYYGDSTTSQHGFFYNVNTGVYTFLDDPSAAFNNGVEVTQITGTTNSGEITASIPTPTASSTVSTRPPSKTVTTNKPQPIQNKSFPAEPLPEARAAISLPVPVPQPKIEH